MNDNQWSDPIFFKVLGHFVFDNWMLGRKLIALQFQQQELEDPSGHLVGVAYWAGRRRYLWSEGWWSEYPLESRIAVEKLKSKSSKVEPEKLDKLFAAIDWVSKYKDSPPPDLEYKDQSKIQSQYDLLTSSGFFKSAPQILKRYMLENLAQDSPKVITRILYPVKN